jgi:hypothetical protein
VAGERLKRLANALAGAMPSNGALERPRATK